MVTLLDHYFQNLNVICVIKCFQSISCQSVFCSFCIFAGLVYKFCNNYTNLSYSETYETYSMFQKEVHCIKIKKSFYYVAHIS